MRPIALFSLVFNLFFIQTLAQDNYTLSRTVFKMSPQHFLQNALKAGIERFDRNHASSVVLLATGRLDNPDGQDFDRAGFDGFSAEFQYRKYASPMKERMSRKGNVYHQGVYGAVYIQGGHYSRDIHASRFKGYPDGSSVLDVLYNYKEDIGNWGGGFTLGYQQTLWQTLFFEAFVGGGIQFSDRIVSGQLGEYPVYQQYELTEPGYRGFMPKMGLNVGIGL